MDKFFAESISAFGFFLGFLKFLRILKPFLIFCDIHIWKVLFDGTFKMMKETEGENGRPRDCGTFLATR